MEIKKHIGFSNNTDSDFFAYLDKNHIPYRKDSLVSSLDMYESDPHWQDVARFIEQLHFPCTSETIFSPEELDSAQWLRVRSQWLNGYPQPDGQFQYETITYSRDNYCSVCGAGLEQVDAFRLQKQPKWGKRNFMMLNWVYDEIFTNERTRNILEQNSVTGISFREVKNKNGTEILEDSYQILISQILSNGVIEDEIGYHEIATCSQCQRKRFHRNGIGMTKYRKELFQDVPDIVKSGDIFGWGHSSSRDIIVHQRVRQIIDANGLGRGLVFDPIMLI